MAKKTRLFHGGPIQPNSGDFAGKLWFSSTLSSAMDYAGEDGVWMMLMDEDREVFWGENDDARETRVEELVAEGWDWSEAAWQAQSEQIKAAFDAGATVYMADDGWAVDMGGRRTKRII